MSISDFRELGESPARPSVSPKGSILQAFPPTQLDVHFRNGYIFRLDPCNVVTGYSPEYCDEHAPKMDPSFYGGNVQVPVRMLQAAFSCSAVGATDDELRYWAKSPLQLRLWANVDTVLTQLLAAQAVSQTTFPIPAANVLSKAAQYLATHSQSGTGIIYGPMSWLSELGMDYLIKWDEDKNHYEDVAGNVIIPSSVDSDLVYAFDSFVDIKSSAIQVLDEFMPAQRTNNDRTVRAEQLYTVAIGPCVVGSFQVGITAIGDSVTVEPGSFPLNVVLVSPGTLLTTATITNVPHVIVDSIPAGSSSLMRFLTGAGTTTVKAGAGHLYRISVLGGSGVNTVTVYDNTIAAGTIIAILDVNKLQGTIEFGATFATGLTVVITGADTNVSVVYD